jgi:hypothetical protein
MPADEGGSSEHTGEGSGAERAGEEAGGPPARHLREFLRHQFGEVPEGSPTEHADLLEDPAAEDEDAAHEGGGEGRLMADNRGCDARGKE